MYTKRGGVAAYHIVRIGLCLRSFPVVRVLASAVDDSTESSTALARTRTPGTLLKHKPILTI